MKFYFDLYGLPYSGAAKSPKPKLPDALKLSPFYKPIPRTSPPPPRPSYYSGLCRVPSDFLRPPPSFHPNQFNSSTMTMTMKRKRSESELSFCNSSRLSSPQLNAMDIDMCMSPCSTYQSHQDTTQSHLPSRTRKRFRDNRPSEAAIHRMPLPTANIAPNLPLTMLHETDNTLSLLYAAQKQAHVDPIPSTTMNTDIIPPDTTSQTSLHTFWADLPSQISNKTSSPSPPPVKIRYQTNCEDCNTSLFITNEETSMDVDFDLCGTSFDYGCSACNKQVCDHCSISNLDAHRQCLKCAGKRRWIGGLGVRDRLFLNHFQIGKATPL